MPAASSRMRRRVLGLALISSAIWPCRTSAGECDAGRGIGEQHLHIARAHILGVDLVGRPRIARDPAHDLELVGIVEPRGRQPFGVVDHQRHFGKVARRAAGGTGKDHILHPVAAHRGGAVFTHHPAQRLQQVGLAAAIGADNARQPVMDHQIRGVHEAFEAVQSDPGETQRAGLGVIPVGPRSFASGRYKSTAAHPIWRLAGGYPQHIGRIRPTYRHLAHGP